MHTVSRGRKEVKTHPVEALPKTAHRRAGLCGLYFAHEDPNDDRPRAREANDEDVEEDDDGPLASRSRGGARGVKSTDRKHGCRDDGSTANHGWAASP